MNKIIETKATFGQAIGPAVRLVVVGPAPNIPASFHAYFVERVDGGDLPSPKGWAKRRIVSLWPDSYVSI